MVNILKNNTASPIIVRSVGQTIPASGQITIPPDDYDNLSADADVISKITSGDITVNDGTADLTISEGLQVITAGISVVSSGGVVATFNGRSKFTLTADPSFSSSGNSQRIFQDFLYKDDSADRNDEGWLGTNNGGVALLETTPTGNDYDGIFSLSASNAGQNPALNSFNKNNRTQFGGKPVSFEWRVRVNSLSDGTNTYNLRIGYQNKVDTASGRAASNVTFEYTHSVNSGRWTGVCSSSSTSTVLNSTISVVANTWVRLRADINASGTLVTFYIDDVSFGTINSNIPINTSLRHLAQLERTLGSAGIKELDIDYVAWRMDR